MAEPPALATARRTFYVLGSAGLTVAGLYWGQRVLIPLALAILLAFVLAPLVSYLEQRGLRRIPAVVLVVLLAFVALGGFGWTLAGQVTDLINDLPAHKESLARKLRELRGAGKGGPLASVQDFLEEVNRAGGPGQEPGVQTVRVRPERPSLFAQLQGVVGHSVVVLSAVLAVLLLVLCLLTHREDLRNRLIRLAGRGRLMLTTRALDEAGRRIGRYLLWHSLVNAAFGVAVGLGLLLIGVPYPLLWGALAGVLRFIPAFGIWLVAPFPAALAAIGSPDWTEAGLVLALFLGLELFNGNVLEPWLSRPSVGVAPLPLLVCVMVWTALWGLTGLMLATPLTVCLAVLGKHVRALEFLGVLLGSRPALEEPTSFYQRLLARDEHEAGRILTDHLAAHPAESVYDAVLLPALALVRRGRKTGQLSPEDEREVLDAARRLVEGLGSRPRAAPAPTGALILGCPACDALDELALEMFRQLLAAAGQAVRLAVAPSGPADVTALVEQEQPAVVFIAAVAPGGTTEARYLCKRLRARGPRLRIVVGRCGGKGDPKKFRACLLAAGADQVTRTLLDSRARVMEAARALPPVGQPA